MTHRQDKTTGKFFTDPTRRPSGSKWLNFFPRGSHHCFVKRSGRFLFKRDLLFKFLPRHNILSIRRLLSRSHSHFLSLRLRAHTCVQKAINYREEQRRTLFLFSLTGLHVYTDLLILLLAANKQTGAIVRSTTVRNVKLLPYVDR